MQMELYRSLIEAFRKFEIRIIGELVKTIGKIYSEKKTDIFVSNHSERWEGIQPIF